jgi:hypothetical protein
MEKAIASDTINTLIVTPFLTHYITLPLIKRKSKLEMLLVKFNGFTIVRYLVAYNCKVYSLVI